MDNNESEETTGSIATRELTTRACSKYPTDELRNEFALIRETFGQLKELNIESPGMMESSIRRVLDSPVVMYRSGTSDWLLPAEALEDLFGLFKHLLTTRAELRSPVMSSFMLAEHVLRREGIRAPARYALAFRARNEVLRHVYGDDMKGFPRAMRALVVLTILASARLPSQREGKQGNLIGALPGEIIQMIAVAAFAMPQTSRVSKTN